MVTHRILVVGRGAVGAGILAALAACAPTRTVVQTEIVEVKVPVVAECPAPPAVVRPGLPISLIDSMSTDGEVAQMYVATVLALQGYAAELERLLDAYRPRSDSLGASVPRTPVGADGAGLQAPVGLRPGDSRW